MDKLDRWLRDTARSDIGMTWGEEGRIAYVSYADLYEEAGRIAVSLAPLRLRGRFMAAVWTGPDVGYYTAVLAIIRAGGIPLFLHPDCGAEEVERLCARFEIELLVTDAGRSGPPDASFPYDPTFSAAAVGCPVYRIDERRLLAPSGSDAPARLRRYTPPEPVRFVFLTSGSSGSPKGVMLSADNVLSNAAAIQRYVGLDRSDVVLVTKSPGYCSTIVGEWLLALQAGAGIRLAPGYRHPRELGEIVRASGATFYGAVPPTAVALARSDDRTSAQFARLRRMIVAGGGVPGHLLAELQVQLPGTDIFPSYGLTEASPRVAYLPREAAGSRPDSAGIPIAGTDVAVIAEGRPAPPGAEGEIVVRGPGVMVGYYDDEERTRRTVTTLGLHTGDRGYRDEAGYLYVTGRTDRAVNIGGQLVYPEPIERALSEHPGVAQASVVAVPDERWGSRFVACVVPLGVAGGREELLRFIQQRLAGAHRPKEVALFDRLPLTASGKIDRIRLAGLVRPSETDKEGGNRHAGTRS